ncbi:MAG: transposase family protein [Planctomycetes bacterium]|nr:transposase family protein [Planctomycetota bacterium]
MNQENLPAERRTLTEVEKQFRSWRSSRKRGSRIPQRLWQAAAELSEQHPISDIALTLGLDYTRLRRRVEPLPSLRTQLASDEVRPGRAGVRFVEVGMVPGRGTGECSVEAEDGRGKKLKMHLKGASCAEAVEIAKALWGIGR